MSYDPNATNRNVDSCKICPISTLCQATDDDQCVETLQLIIETYNEKLGTIRGFIDDLDGTICEIEQTLDDYDDNELTALSDRWEEECMEENTDEYPQP